MYMYTLSGWSITVYNAQTAVDKLYRKPSVTSGISISPQMIAEDTGLSADLCRIRKDLWLREEKNSRARREQKGGTFISNGLSARGDLLPFRILQASFRA